MNLQATPREADTKQVHPEEEKPQEVKPEGRQIPLVVNSTLPREETNLTHPREE